jgi:hypothetical protein
MTDYSCQEEYDQAMSNEAEAMADLEAQEYFDNHPTKSQPKENKCDCPCHTSKSSSEDMKKNGCDLCYCDSEYYPRHPKSQPNISEVMKEARKWLEENEFISYRVDGATDEIWEADQLVVNRLVYLINKAIKEAFKRTRPPYRESDLERIDKQPKECSLCCVLEQYFEGWRDCLQELKSNEEEYLK